MGEEIARDVGKSNGLPIPPPPGRTTPGGNSSAATPGTRTDPGTGNPKGNETGPRTGETEKEKTPGLAPVTPPVPEQPKKKQTRQPRKKKEEKTSFTSEQISALIVGATSIVASREGLAVFALTKPEADQLADPIAKMIAKSERLQNAGEYADAIALVTASLIIFVPRLLLYYDQEKKKKIEKNGGVKLVRQETESRGDAKQAPGKSTGGGLHGNSSIASAIPSLV